MKTTINGKRYDSEKCEKLVEKDHYYNGDYIGTTTLLLASDGTYLSETVGNGHSAYIRNSLERTDTVKLFLEGLDITDEQEARLVELGLLTIVD